MPEIPPPQLINALRFYDLLPAIVFVPSRKRCDQAATEVALDKSQKTDVERAERRKRIFEEFVGENPEIEKHKHRRILLRSGVASHHAGHIPAWKFLIERMMSEGLVNALFATSTVAAGVDFPARSVVISNADTRGNDGWRSLEASELQQMTGRAGRRGKDNVGFAILAPGNFQNPPKIAELLNSPPDPLESKFRATYSSLLNLLDAFKSFHHLREIAEKSFAFRGTGHHIQKLKRKRDKIRAQLEQTAKEAGLSLDDLLGFERLASVQNRVVERTPNVRAAVRENWLRENVKAGRLVSKGKSGKQYYLVLSVFGDKVVTIRGNGRGGNLSLGQIRRIYSKTYEMDPASIERAFLEIHEGKNPIVREPKISFVNENSEEASALVGEVMDGFFGDDPDRRKPNERLLWGSVNDADAIRRIDRDISYLKDEIWLPFENRARILNHFGYLNFADELVTPEGEWLADLRIDNPLLAGEALRLGAFDGLGAAQTAGLVAALTADYDREYGRIYLTDELLDAMAKVDDIVESVSRVERRYGVPASEEINYSAAGVAESWASGAEWSDLVWETRAEEGDLVRLLSRTGEALLQIAHLKSSNPEAARLAREASELVLREPVR